MVHSEKAVFQWCKSPLVGPKLTCNNRRSVAVPLGVKQKLPACGPSTPYLLVHCFGATGATVTVAGTRNSLEEH